jgi:hypothetical protein
MKTSTLTVFLAILTPIFGFLGVLVGHWGSRAREVRALRARAYAEWLQAAEQFPLFDPTEPGIVLPAMKAITRMLNVQADLTAIAPVAVLDATNVFVATVTSDKYRSAFSGVATNDPRAILDKHQQLTRSVRVKAAEQKRKDLLPWWQGKARGLPRQGQEPLLDSS